MTSKKTASPAEALRAALAAYVLSTYGIPIEGYRDAWFKAGSSDARYPFETLHVVDFYDSLAGEQNRI